MCTVFNGFHFPTVRLPPYVPWVILSWHIVLDFSAVVFGQVRIQVFFFNPPWPTHIFPLSRNEPPNSSPVFSSPCCKCLFLISIFVQLINWRRLGWHLRNLVRRWFGWSPANDNQLIENCSCWTRWEFLWFLWNLEILICGLATSLDKPYVRPVIECSYPLHSVEVLVP